MHIRRIPNLLAVVIALGTAVPVVAFAADGKDDTTPLEDQMDTLNTGMRALRTALADASTKSTALRQLKNMIDAATTAKGYDPKLLAEIPATQKEKFLADYQAGIEKLIAALTALRDAVTAGRQDEVVKIFATLDEIKTDSHSKFRKETEKEKAEREKAAAAKK